MTVNIGLVTSDALVLGCDSVASSSEYLLDPFSLIWEQGPDGKPLEGPDGKWSVRFAREDFRQIVTNAWGGVTKMFEIHPSPSPVVAVTAGLAKLNERPIASLANEFFAGVRDRKRKLVRIEVICDQFLQFMRKKYIEHYRDSKLDEQFRDGPEFLIGGFGRDDAFPSIHRLSVQANTVKAEFAGGNSGVAWNGQSDAVERFIRGYDGNLKHHIDRRVLAAVKGHSTKMQQYVTGLVNQILDSLQEELPPGIAIELPEVDNLGLNWEQFFVPIDYANIPLQEAVSFVAALVMTQASKSRFARGVATVGGRTHIGVVTKQRGFEILNEPALTHRYTGFGDDV